MSSAPYDDLNIEEDEDDVKASDCLRLVSLISWFIITYLQLQTYTPTKDGLYICIDYGPSMQVLLPPPDGKEPKTGFQIAIAAAFASVKNALFTGQTYLGILFYGTVRFALAWVSYRMLGLWVWLARSVI